ncbi:nuclear transport factor 2 family protein [Paenibacillus sp. MMO-58]|uniref:nuclear transport factor 2 family protein n=1 Tax=Paenibacillus sp. MMO-58 TaxID=3081290 RepID=UPI0030189A57
MIIVPVAVANYFNAVNEQEPERFLEAFDEQSHVLVMKKEYVGGKAIAKWSKTEIFEPKVRFEMKDAKEQDNRYIITVAVDGEFDKTNLPDPLLMKHEFLIANDKIKELHISFP